VKVPRPIARLIESFERLPGIGPKTAQRLTFHLLHFPQEDLERFAEALVGLKTGTKLCSVCKNVTEYDVCSICSDTTREQYTVAVVASPLDVFSLEKTNYRGVYHVLHGVIDPLNHIGPEELFIKELKERMSNMCEQSLEVPELILALNTGMEGESTALYISKMLRDIGLDASKLKITRIARGLPVGGDIEYADDVTLSRALEGRAIY